MSSPNIPEEKMEMRGSHDSLKVTELQENVLRLEPLFLIILLLAARNGTEC